MTNYHDKKDPVIEHYPIPQPSDGFAEKIIMAAQNIPQKKSWQKRLAFMTDFQNRPALSYGVASVILACLLISGMPYIKVKTPVPPAQEIVSGVAMVTDYTLDDLFAEDKDSLLIL